MADIYRERAGASTAWGSVACAAVAGNLELTLTSDSEVQVGKLVWCVFLTHDNKFCVKFLGIMTIAALPSAGDKVRFASTRVSSNALLALDGKFLDNVNLVTVEGESDLYTYTMQWAPATLLILQQHIPV